MDCSGYEHRYQGAIDALKEKLVITIPFKKSPVEGFNYFEQMGILLTIMGNLYGEFGKHRSTMRRVQEALTVLESPDTPENFKKRQSFIHAWVLNICGTKGTNN